MNFEKSSSKSFQKPSVRSTHSDNVYGSCYKKQNIIDISTSQMNYESNYKTEQKIYKRSRNLPMTSSKNIQKPSYQKLQLRYGNQIRQFDIYKDQDLGFKRYAKLTHEMRADEDSMSTDEVIRKGQTKTFKDLQNGIQMNQYSIFDSDEYFEIGSDTHKTKSLKKP